MVIWKAIETVLTRTREKRNWTMKIGEAKERRRNQNKKTEPLCAN
jgi:hypothetical protein